MFLIFVTCSVFSVVGSCRSDLPTLNQNANKQLLSTPGTVLVLLLPAVPLGRSGAAAQCPTCSPRAPISTFAVFIFQNLTREQADYCISHMKPYMDGKGRELPSAYDYIEFTRSLFVN